MNFDILITVKTRDGGPGLKYIGDLFHNIIFKLKKKRCSLFRSHDFIFQLTVWRIPIEPDTIIGTAGKRTDKRYSQHASKHTPIGKICGKRRDISRLPEWNSRPQWEYRHSISGNEVEDVFVAQKRALAKGRFRSPLCHLQIPQRSDVIYHGCRNFPTDGYRL